MVRFTVDVRAAMAVGEDPVANKQKKTSAFKSQQIHLTDSVCKMGENILLIPCPSPSPNLFLTAPSFFSQSR